MSEFFPNGPPKRPSTPEEKTRLARKFRRRALLVDGLFLLAFVCLGAPLVFPGWAAGFAFTPLMLAAILSSMTFSRCPCCGRLARRGEWFGPFAWRGFECPVCWFSPDWSK